MAKKCAVKDCEQKPLPVKRGDWNAIRHCAEHKAKFGVKFLRPARLVNLETDRHLINDLDNLILGLVYDADKLTTSDLQGCVSALSCNIIDLVRKQDQVKMTA